MSNLSVYARGRRLHQNDKKNGRISSSKSLSSKWDDSQQRVVLCPFFPIKFRRSVDPDAVKHVVQGCRGRCRSRRGRGRRRCQCRLEEGRR